MASSSARGCCPPLTTLTFGVSAGASAAAGLAAGVAFGVAASTQDRATAEGMGTVALVTGAAAAIGAVATLIEVPFVDWDDVASQNDQLVADSVSRQVSRRLAPEPAGRRRRPEPRISY